jgi:hypothetical protein
VLEDSTGGVFTPPPEPLPVEPPSLPSQVPQPQTPPTPAPSAPSGSVHVPDVTAPVTKAPPPPHATLPDGGGLDVPPSGVSAGSGGRPAGEPSTAPPAGSGSGLGARSPFGAEDGSAGSSPEAPTRSVDVSEPARLRRWIAYVWPAVALGRIGGAILPLMASLERTFGRLGSDFQPLAALGGAFAGAAATAIPGAPGPTTGRSAQSDPGRSILPLSSGGMGLLTIMLIVLLSLVAAIALARLVVGEEVFSPHRPPHRRRGHRDF